MEGSTYRPSLKSIANTKANLRSRVRAHVGRQRRRCKLWEEQQSATIPRSGKLGNRNALVISRSKESESKCMQEMVHPELLGAGRKDPFANYPLQAVSNEELELLDHFFCSVAPQQFSLDNRRDAFIPIKHLSFSAAAHDDAAFHLLLASAASDMGRLGKSEKSTVGIIHKMTALRIVNQRMTDVALATRDGNIGAVAIFAGFELLHGTPDIFNLHMNGLEQLIKRRGGLRSIRLTNPQLEQFITWIDYAGASNLISMRRFASLPAKDADLVYSPIALRPPNSMVFRDAPERYDLYRDLIHTISIAERVIKSSCLQLPNTLEECLVNNLDRELYQLFQLPANSSIVARRCLIQEVWRLGAIICISAVSRFRLSQADQAKWIAKFQQRFRALLGTKMEWGNMIEVLALSLLLGQSLETIKSTERLNSLMIMSISLTLETWRTVKQRLLHFLVLEDICQGRLQNLWRLRLGFIPSSAVYPV